MNQIKSTSEVTLTDLRRLGLQGDATARLASGEEMKLTSKYGLIPKKGYVAGKLQTVEMIAEYSKIYRDIRTIKRGDILVAIGGVIPAQDYEFLREHGAVAIFGPGTVLPVAAKKLLETLTSHVQDEGND